MEWLNQSLFENNISDLLLVSVIIVFIFLLRHFISNHLASFFFNMIRRKWNSIDKNLFLSKILGPLGWLIAFSLSSLALEHLQFPDDWNLRYRSTDIHTVLEKMLFLLLFFLFIRCMLGLIEFIAAAIEHKTSTAQLQRSQQLIVFFKDFLKTIVYIVGLFGALKIGFDIDLGSLITGLSIVGAALALAAKESVENLIASFIIFFDKPFSINDTVRVQQINGTIESIGLRSTRIRTAEHTLVTVPNKQMVDSIVDNWNQRTARKYECLLEFSADNTIEKIGAFSEQVHQWLEKQGNQLVKHQVLMTTISKWGIQLSIEIHTPAGEHELEKHQQLRSALIQFIHQTIQQEDLTLAKPTTS